MDIGEASAVVRVVGKVGRGGPVHFPARFSSYKKVFFKMKDPHR
jgi:hypothetical protein